MSLSKVQVETKEKESACEKHGEFKSIITVINKREYATGCPTCVEMEAKEAEKKRRAEEVAERISRMIGRSGLPKRFLDRTFDNYREETPGQIEAKSKSKSYADSFEEKLSTGGGLIFVGAPGTGKTHLAAAIANQVMRSLRTVIFTTALKAIRDVKNTYSRDSQKTEQDVIESYALPDLLILDEIGVQRGTDTEQMILFEIINERYENFRPTILMSNLTLSEIKAYLGERNIDRMREGGGDLVAFDWDSYRTKVHKDKKLPCGEVKPSWFQV